MKGVRIMMKINKEKINLSPKLTKKINWASKYTSTPIKTLESSLIMLEPTNIAYVETHKVIINGITLLFFNNNQYFYVNNLDNKYRLTDLEDYLNLIKKTNM